jgi:Tfp pilus assembly protein PilV
MPDHKPPELRRTSLSGLSLIEVCIAIVVLAVILTSLSSVFNQGYRFLRKTRLSQTACFLAQEKMEQLLHNNATFDYLATINGTENPLPAPFQNFWRTVNVTSPAAAGTNATVNASLALINVKVYWQGQRGQQNFTLISLVSNTTH